MIYIVLLELIQDCPVYEAFQKEFVGENLSKEIQSQIDKAEKEKFQRPKLRFESNFDWLFEQITRVKVSRDNLRSQKDPRWSDPRLIPLWDQGGYRMSDLRTSQIISHVTCYKFKALIGRNYSIYT